MKLYNHSSALWYVCEVIKFAIIVLHLLLKFYSSQKRSVWIRMDTSLFEFQCLWLIVTHKTIMDIRTHFQCKLPVWFQDFYEIWVIKYSVQLENLYKAWKEVTWLEERQSLPELRVMCTIAGEWSHWNSLEAVTRGQNIGIKSVITKGQNPEYELLEIWESLLCLELWICSYDLFVMCKVHWIHEELHCAATSRYRSCIFSRAVNWRWTGSWVTFRC